MHGAAVQSISAGSTLRSNQGDDSTCDFSHTENYFLDEHEFPASEERDFEVADQETVNWHTRQVKVECFEESPVAMSNTTSASGEASVSTGNRGDGVGSTFLQQHHSSMLPTTTALNNTGQAAPVKKKRNLPGTPDPDAEVIALSPKTLLATNRFVCEICNKGFQRDQNLQLHRRGHNLPWKLKQRTSKENKKRVYICPEPSCVHHDPSRALGDLTGIKKHFCRKHGEKKWKCEKCSKRYAVQSDWKAHSKTCGTREYRCDCGTLFSRRDSFITHRAFCDALAEETARVSDSIQNNHAQSVQGNGLGTGHTGGPMSMMGAPSSPGRTNIFSLNGNVMDPLSSEPFLPFRQGLQGGASRVGAVPNGVSAVPLRWDQENTNESATPGARPRLSLWLGTGPGPGASNSEQLVRGPQQLQSGGLASMNGFDPNTTFFVQSLRTVQDGGGVFSPSDYDDQKPLSYLLSNMAGGSSSSGNQNHYRSLFATGGPLAGMTGSTLAQSGGTTGVGMSEFADMGSVTNWINRTSASGRSSLSTTAGLANSSATGHFNGNGTLSSLSFFYNQTGSHTAQMSATALLQKAAQMSATASNSSLLRGSGMAGSDSTRWSSSGQDHVKGGFPNLMSSLVESQPVMKGPTDLPPPQVLGSSLGTSSHLGGNTRNTENSGLHELMNTLSGSSSVFGGLTNLPPLVPSLGLSDNMGVQFPENGSLYNRMQSRENMERVSQHPSGVSSQNPFIANSMLRGVNNLQRGENGPGDRLTRDFLGVGGANGMVGSTGVARTLSQRDLANIASFIPGMGMNDFSNHRDNLQSVGVGPCLLESPGILNERK